VLPALWTILWIGDLPPSRNQTSGQRHPARERPALADPAFHQKYLLFQALAAKNLRA
jgi:hypothetical protein